MDLVFNGYAVTLLVSGVLVLLFATYLAVRSESAVRWFSGGMSLNALWAITYAMELASGELSAILFWIRLEYVAIAFVPAVWFVFVLKYVGRETWLTLRNSILIFGLPSLTLLAVWTNPWHRLHYRTVGLDTTGPFPLLSFEPGPWYHVHTVFFYALMGFGLFLLIARFRRADPVYRRQNTAILGGALIPWISNFAYLLGFRLYGHIDPTPFAFLGTSFVLGFALVRFRLFDVVPLARERVIEGLREGMLVLDRDGRVIDLNATMRGFLGGHADRAVGGTLAAFFPGQGFLEGVAAAAEGGRVEMDLGSGDHMRTVDVRVTPLHDERGHRCGTLLIFWDITDRKHASQLLESQAAQLRNLNQLKTRMLSIIAHDLRTPLASLTGVLQIADSGMLTDQEFRDLIPMISRGVTDASGLLENLLHWSKSQLEGEVIQPERFNLKDLITQNLVLFEKKLAEKEVKLLDSVAADAEVFADRNMMSLVIRNLVGNAVKFSRPGDRIGLSSLMDADCTTLCVADTGVGMDPGLVGKLFGFDIVSRPGTQQERGTGLGLKLCRDFVEKNGGVIRVESASGKGSRFFVSLPRRRVTAPVEQAT
jgi:signal transduction histidine kinase